MTLTVAGEKKEYAAGLTVEQLIEAENVETPQYVTVTINDEFLPTEERTARILQDGDEVEFLYFMGGGCARPSAAACSSSLKIRADATDF